MSRASRFRRIDFGYASAQAEARENPNLLLKDFLDTHQFSDRIARGREWLVLGYKGSGKSAIAERLRLMHESDSNTFIELSSIEDFEYARFADMAKGDEATETRLPTAWSWLIYAFLLNSFFKDHGLQVNSEEELDQIKSSFETMGLSPVYDLNSIVRTSSEDSFRLAVPKFADKKWTKRSEKQDVDFRWYVYNLRPFIANLRSSSTHLLVIDGLDDILATSTTQYTSIGALIFETQRINDYLKRYGVPAKVVVLCRTDIFELLRGPNKNKIRQDYAIDLDWNSNPKTPSRSPLQRIANLRGQLSLGRQVSVIDDLLPHRLGRRSTRKAILDMTRHTPRDFLQLLSYLQGSIEDDPISQDDLRNGVREYSTKYFLPEIHDELDGYATAEEIQGITRTIEQIARRDFSYDDVVNTASDAGWEPNRKDLEKVLRVLYECSAIGNVRMAMQKGKRYLSFKYRNRHSSYKRQERIILHRGLWRAFNIQWEPFGKDIDPDNARGV